MYPLNILIFKVNFSLSILIGLMILKKKGAFSLSQGTVESKHFFERDLY